MFYDFKGLTFKLHKTKWMNRDFFHKWLNYSPTLVSLRGDRREIGKIGQIATLYFQMALK